MKSLCKKSLFATALIAVACLFHACSDKESSSISPQVADFTVRSNNGYLEFKDQKTFDEVMATLKNADRETLDAWESQFSDFISLRSIEENAIDAQEAWFEKLRNMRCVNKSGHETLLILCTYENKKQQQKAAKLRC